METFTAQGFDWGRSNTSTGPILNNPPNRPEDGFPVQQGNWLVRPVADLPAIPLPPAVWLFGSALSGLLGWGRARSPMA